MWKDVVFSLCQHHSYAFCLLSPRNFYHTGCTLWLTLPNLLVKTQKNPLSARTLTCGRLASAFDCLRPDRECRTENFVTNHTEFCYQLDGLWTQYISAAFILQPSDIHVEKISVSGIQNFLFLRTLFIQHFCDSLSCSFLHYSAMKWICRSSGL